MGKRKKKIEDTATKTKGKPERKTNSDPITDQEERFDFGGFPERDLKKNLGCG